MKDDKESKDSKVQVRIDELRDFQSALQVCATALEKTHARMVSDKKLNIGSKNYINALKCFIGIRNFVQGVGDPFYLDEFGHILDVIPDPKKRSEEDEAEVSLKLKDTRKKKVSE